MSFFHSSSTLSSRFLFASCRMWAVVSFGSCVSREFRMKLMRFIIMTSIELFRSMEARLFCGLPVSRFGKFSVCFTSRCYKESCSREYISFFIKSFIKSNSLMRISSSDYILASKLNTRASFKVAGSIKTFDQSKYLFSSVAVRSRISSKSHS